MLGAGVLIAVVQVVGVAASAADEPPDPAITGRLVADGRPVAGVEVEARRAGRQITRVRSGPDGSFELPTGPGTFRVAVDPGTIPAGVRLVDPERVALPRVVVQPGQDKVVVFAFGRDGADATPPTARSAVDRYASAVVAGLRIGAVVALAAVGLTLVFSTSGLLNFAHGELVAFGAVVAWYLNDAGIPLVAAGALAGLAGAALGAGLEVGLWRPLRDRGTNTSAAMVISIGVGLFLRNVYLLLMEGPARAYAQHAVQRPWRLGPVSVMPKHVALMATAAVLLTGAALVLSRTLEGAAVRAVADDHDLAESSGVDVRRVLLRVAAGSAALAAVGGVLLGTTENVQWDMGGRVLLLTIAAAVLGGLGSVTGAVAAALVLGVAMELGSVLGASELKVAIALATMVAVLLVRPSGLRGLQGRAT